MTWTDPFSAVMGDLRGQRHPDSPEAPGATPAHTSSATDAERESGVSSSGLPFQAISRDDAIVAVRTCATALGCTPSVSQYEHWRYAESVRRPSVTTVLRRLGTWRRAVQAAGL